MAVLEERGGGDGAAAELLRQLGSTEGSPAGGAAAPGSPPLDPPSPPSEWEDAQLDEAERMEVRSAGRALGRTAQSAVGGTLFRLSTLLDRWAGC